MVTLYILVQVFFFNTIDINNTNIILNISRNISMDDFIDFFKNGWEWVVSKDSLFWGLCAVGGLHCLIPKFKNHEMVPWVLRAVTFYLELRLVMVLIQRDMNIQEYFLFGIYVISLARSLLSIGFEDKKWRIVSDQVVLDVRWFHWLVSFGLLIYALFASYPVLKAGKIIAEGSRAPFPEVGAMYGVMACRWLWFDRWDRFLWSAAPGNPIFCFFIHMFKFLYIATFYVLNSHFVFQFC